MFPNFEEELHNEVSRRITMHVAELTLANLQNTVAAELLEKRLKFYEDAYNKRMSESEASVQEPVE